MAKLLEIMRNQPRLYLTETEVEKMLKASPDSRYGKMKRLLGQKKLVRVRRGLYYLVEKEEKPHPFALAQLIYGPSYISLESALSFHRLIPETTFTVTSATSKRSKEFKTPLGIFSFQHVPSENLLIEVELIQENGYPYFMAKPWKAISDFVFCYKKDWQNLKPLTESLRINLEDLPPLTEKEIENLDEYYHQKRISRFLKGVKRDLQEVTL